MIHCNECGERQDIDAHAHYFSGYGWDCQWCPDHCPREMDGIECEGVHPQPLDDRYETVAGMVSAALGRGYTQQQLADRLGVSRRSVHAWLHKRSLPTDSHYSAIRQLVRKPLPLPPPELKARIMDRIQPRNPT